MNALASLFMPADDPVETFLNDNEIIGDPAADDLRGCPPDVQQIVMDGGTLRTARNPAASLVIRIKNARKQCGSVYEGSSKGRPPASPGKGAGGAAFAGIPGLEGASGAVFSRKAAEMFYASLSPV